MNINVATNIMGKRHQNDTKKQGKNLWKKWRASEQVLGATSRIWLTLFWSTYQ